MIAPTDIPSVRSPVLADTPTSVSATINAAQETLSNLTQSAVGKLFQAQVLAQLDDGTFLVNVADTPIRMALPAGTSVSDTLTMTLLATDPRPAFLLEQQSSSTSASLSSAAKLIDTVIQTAQQTSAPTTLVGKAPLVASPAVSTPELATALQDSVEFSGVFYESHISQWVSGERPLSDLLREPQIQAQIAAQEDMPMETPSQTTTPMQTATQTATARTTVDNPGTLLPRPSTAAPEADLSKLVSNVPGAPGTRPSLAQTLSGLANTLSKDTNAAKEADTFVRSTSLTPENAQTINLQLNTLEQHRIAWQGELWPGQQMEWEISEDESGRSQGGEADENQSSWRSVVRFELPGLGKVSASIHLAGGHVRMQIGTASASAASQLTAHADSLADALSAAGSPLDSLIIKQDGQT